MLPSSTVLVVVIMPVPSKLIFSRNSLPFRSEPRNGLFRDKRISAKGALFPRNNKSRSVSFPRKFFERNFDGNPTSTTQLDLIQTRLDLILNSARSARSHPQTARSHPFPIVEILSDSDSPPQRYAESSTLRISDTRSRIPDSPYHRYGD